MASGEYIPRHVDRLLDTALKTVPIVVIDGPRAVGKTTSAQRVAKSTLRLPVDGPLLEFNPAATLAGLPTPVLIDEWQLAGTDLLWTLKQIVDDNPTPGQFLLTGSVEPATYGPTYPLTGRANQVTMYPMTQAELKGDGHKPSFLDLVFSGEVPKPGVRTTPPISLADLFTTGFPAARAQSDPSMFLTSYAALVAQRAGDEGRDATRLSKTLAVLGVLSGQAVPDQRIWESADINKATWKAYEDLLARTHLSAPLSAFSSNALSRLTSYPKRFLVDTSLALALADLTPGDLQHDPALIGRFVESFATQQIRAQAQVLGARLSHLRTSGGQHEVDLIVEARSQRVAFEIKAGSRPKPDDAKHLRWLERELGGDFSLLAVLHTGADTYQLDENIWAIPISLL